MKIYKYLIPFLAISASCFGQFFGQETAFDRQLRNRDDQALKDFVGSKEDTDIKKKADNLEISGDVRFEYQNIHEKGLVLFDPEGSYIGNNASNSFQYPEQYRNIRNHVGADGIPLSENNLDVEFNFKLKYTYDKAWCYAHLQFDNPAGVRGPVTCERLQPVFNRAGDKVLDRIPEDTREGLKGSGFAGSITLKRAYIGYNLWEECNQNLDVQLGRCKFDDVFISEVQFSNRFDGALLLYTNEIEGWTDLYCNVGAFSIDQSVNQFGYVGEIGFLNIVDSGLDLRYSFIDWQKQGMNRCHRVGPLGSDFINSQISFSYNLKPRICDRELPIEVYGGFLVNHAARKTIYTEHKLANLAGYAGVTFGAVRKKGDWSVDVEWIYIQAQAVPDIDVGSIGRGNIMNEGLYDAVDFGDDSSSGDSSSDGSSSSSRSSSSSKSRDDKLYYNRRGNANFSGFRIEALYALTDNFSFDVIYETSAAIETKIGGRHFYHNFEIEAIYAF